MHKGSMRADYLKMEMETKRENLKHRKRERKRGREREKDASPLAKLINEIFAACLGSRGSLA